MELPDTFEWALDQLHETSGLDVSELKRFLWPVARVCPHTVLSYETAGQPIEFWIGWAMCYHFRHWPVRFVTKWMVANLSDLRSKEAADAAGLLLVLTADQTYPS